MTLSRGARRKLEGVGLTIVGLLTVALVVASLHFEREVGRQKTMFYQLQLMRTSVQLYKAVRHVNPPTLKTLVTEEYRFPAEPIPRRFLEYPPFDDAGQLSDPFGSPYRYDVTRGWVTSTTSGYERW